MSRSFAGTAPNPDTTICSILSILFSASPFLNESSVGQPVLSVVEGPHPENEIAKIGKIKQLNPKLLAKKKIFFTHPLYRGRRKVYSKIPYNFK